MSYQELSRPPSFEKIQVTKRKLHKHIKVNSESKYDLLPHQQLFRGQGVPQITNKKQQFKPKPITRASSQQSVSLMNFLMKMNGEGFDIRDTRTDKVCFRSKYY